LGLFECTRGGIDSAG